MGGGEGDEMAATSWRRLTPLLPPHQALIDSDSWLVRAVGWLVAGVAVSQLAADIQIMSHRIRLRKPQRQARDGPPGSAAKLAAWLAQFYSAGSDKVGKGAFLDW